ncbi:MAG TPA: SAM-dependent chlorinase/fluorinase [candidate division Zixibacteria bacterium]
MTKFVTLTTDFGLNDSYVGQVKGVILKINPNVNLIDITHQIPAWDVLRGAFVLNSFYKYFPKGTIHLVVVDPTVGSKRKRLLIQTRDYVFVGPDNGIFSFIYENEEIREILEIRNNKFFLNQESSTFHARDIFAPVVGYLSWGVEISQFGPKVKDCVKLNLPLPEIKKDSIKGEIIYIDRFGNLISNISREHLNGFEKTKVSLTIGNRKIEKLSRSYSDAKPKQILALVNSSNLLEISVRQNRADEVLNVKIGDKLGINLK